MTQQKNTAKDRYEWVTVQCGMYVRRERQWIGFW